MGEVVAFPPKEPRSGSDEGFPLKVQRLRLMVAHHALQAIAWTRQLNAEMVELGYPPLPISEAGADHVRKEVDELAHLLMLAPAESPAHLQLKRGMLAGLFDVTWKPEWLEQLHRDEEAIGPPAA